MIRPRYFNPSVIVQSNLSESRGGGLKIKIRKNKNGYLNSRKNMDKYVQYLRSFIEL